MGQYIEVIATFRGGEMETKRALDSLKKWCSVGDGYYEELGKKKVLPGGEVERRAYFSGNNAYPQYWLRANFGLKENARTFPKAAIPPWDAVMDIAGEWGSERLYAGRTGVRTEGEVDGWHRLAAATVWLDAATGDLSPDECARNAIKCLFVKNQVCTNFTCALAGLFFTDDAEEIEMRFEEDTQDARSFTLLLKTLNLLAKKHGIPKDVAKGRIEALKKTAMAADRLVKMKKIRAQDVEAFLSWVESLELAKVTQRSMAKRTRKHTGTGTSATKPKKTSRI